ncbi:MAG: deoxyribose-phosphate aldolase [Phyllobacterium sp.]
MTEAERKAVAKRALRLIDLTDLNDDSSNGAVTALCAKAQTPHGNTAAICIWPRFIKTARPLLDGTGVKIATVVNFPGGGTGIEAVLAETRQAIADGADEIDLVLPYRDFIAHGDALSRAMVRAVQETCGSNAILKVILETGEIRDEALIRRASELALSEGADFIKTSTGKVKVNATLEAARIMLTAIRDSGRKAGFKPAGGIRSVEDARHYLALADEIMGEGWAKAETFRFGASGLLDDVLAALEGTAHEGGSAY